MTHGLSEPGRLGWLRPLILATLLAVAAGACSGPTGQPVTTQAPTTAGTPGTTTGPRQTATPVFPAKGPHLGYGMNVHLYYQDYDRVLGMVKAAGFDWVRQQIAWQDIEGPKGFLAWDEVDRIVQATNRNQVKMIASVAKGPAWATPDGKHGMPRDPKDFGDFMRAMAKRYKGRIAAYEMWNEQNTAGETAGRIDVGQYARLLQAGFEAVKAEDPQAVVLYGGLTPTATNDPQVAINDVTYLTQSYQFENGAIKKYFDVLGVHPGGTLNPPDTKWPDNPGPGPGWRDDNSFYFRRVEDLRAVMEQNGDAGKQIWLTEFGWPSTNRPAPGYEYAQHVSEKQQADYLVGAYTMSKENYPWMGVMALWNLNFSTFLPPENEMYAWSIINADWSPRPAYTALKEMKK